MATSTVTQLPREIIGVLPDLMAPPEVSMHSNHSSRVRSSERQDRSSICLWTKLDDIDPQCHKACCWKGENASCFLSKFLSSLILSLTPWYVVHCSVCM